MRTFAIAALLAASAWGQQFEAAGILGYSTTDGDDQARSNNPLYGASFRWPVQAGHSIQADYAFVDFGKRIYSRHFVTGSWVRAARAGRVRPFFQLGAGAYVETADLRGLNLPPEVPQYALQTTSTDFCLIVGAGATVDIGTRFFLRPMLRGYLYVGPTLTLAPALAAGLHF